MYIISLWVAMYDDDSGLLEGTYYLNGKGHTFSSSVHGLSGGFDMSSGSLEGRVDRQASRSDEYAPSRMEARGHLVRLDEDSTEIKI